MPDDQFDVFAKTGLLDQLGYQLAKLADFQWFLQKSVEGMLTHLVGVDNPGYSQYRQFRILLFHFPQQFDAVHPRHVNVGNHQIRHVRFQGCQGSFAAVCLHCVKLMQCISQQAAHTRFVVDQQYALELLLKHALVDPQPYLRKLCASFLNEHHC